MASSSKCNNFDWNIETTKLLIGLYEENECLYNNLHPEYKNRDKRLSILSNIAKLICDSTGRVCVVADIRKKINSLRSQYLAEKLKITKSKSGSDGEYTPTAYWFPLLRFMDISTEADASQSNLDIETDLDRMDTQQTREEEKEQKNKTTKNKKKRLNSAEDEDELIREATATMRRMSQHITSNAQVNSDINFTAFCNFINIELISIFHASNNYFVNKVKRKIQMCLFDIWDEIEAGNMHEERPSMLYTNYSKNKNPMMSQSTKMTCRSDVLGSADNVHEDRPSTQLTNYSQNKKTMCRSVVSENDDNVREDSLLSTQFTNYSKNKNPMMSQNTKKTCRSVVLGSGDNEHKDSSSTQLTNYSKNPTMSQNAKKTSRSLVLSNNDNVHNYSKNSIMPKNIKRPRFVVTGNASSLVIKRNDLSTYSSPQENDTVKISAGEEDNNYETVEMSTGEDTFYETVEIATGGEDNICVSTQDSNKNIVNYINSYDPEKFCTNK